MAALADGAVPDVVLVDIGLPGLNGLEAVKRIKSISPSTRVVMLTVFDDHDKIFRAIRAGASGYLLKTSPMERIIESVREAYAGGGLYVGSKTAVLALTRVLRKELVGRIRVSTVDPGMVGGTEFSDVRFRGDQERKRAVYEGVDFVTAEDVADCILWVVTRPPHVCVEEVVLKPLQQASQDVIVRR